MRAARRSSMTTARGAAAVSAPPRTFQRTVYRPGETASSTSGSRAAEIPVGHGQTRRGWVVIAWLGYSRAVAGALVFSKQTPDIAVRDRAAAWRGWGRCRRRWSGIARARSHAAAAARPSEFAAFCGQLAVGWVILRRRRLRRPRARSSACQGFMRRNFEPGRRFANELDFQHQLDGWFAIASTRACTRRCARVAGRPARRGARSDGAAAGGDARHRPALGDARAARSPTCASTATTTRSTRAWSAAASRSASRQTRGHWRSRWTPASSPAGTRACSPAASTITALEHAGALERQRGERRARRDVDVEIRPLARYDALIPHDPRRVRARAPVPRAEGAGRRPRAAQARRPRPRASSGAMSSFAAALLTTEVDRRDSHGGEGRIKAARFPARKTLEEFDFTFQRSVKRDGRRAPRPARLPARAARTSSCSARPVLVHTAPSGSWSDQSVQAGAGTLMASPLRRPLGDVDGVQFAALDLVQHGLAGAAERAGRRRRARDSRRGCRARSGRGSRR